MSQWKVGIVGLRRGRGFVDLFAAHPRVEVAALCDLDGGRLAELGEAFALPPQRRFTDFDAFLDAPTDIIVIATPIALHAEQTVRSLQAGKHVLCEQTAAYTLDDCRAVVQAVRRTGRTYMMAENYTYYHYVRQWKQLIDAGKLGEIFYAEAEYVHEIIDLLIDPETGRYHWRHERPPIWYCAHCLGPLLTLMDDRVVAACGSHAGFHRRGDQSDHPGFLDMQVALFRTAKGKLIKILRSQVAPRYPHLVWYCLYGTKGYVENGRFDTDGGQGRLFIEGEDDPAAGARAIDCSRSDPDAPEAARLGGHGTSEYYLIRDFLDALESGTPPPIDAARAMDFTVPGIVAHESSITDGNWRDVPLLDP